MTVRQLKRVFLVLLLYLLSAQPGWSSSICGGNFEFSELTDQSIFAQYEGAILRIKSGRHTGTGFLIDAQQGYVLTAAHVVEESINDPSAPILGTSPVQARRSLKLKVRKELWKSGDKTDVALLQLEPADALSNVFPIEISFRPFKPGTLAYVMGYARGEDTLSKRRAEIEKNTQEDGFVVKGDPFPGDSGSPLISSTGMAIAIGRSQISGQVAHFTPLADALELFKEIPATARMKELDQKIRAKAIDEEELSEELMPGRTASSARNLELVSWAADVATRTGDYREMRQLFDCPITTAFWHRNLEAAVQFLKSVTSAAVRAKTELMLAQNAALMERTTDALNFWQTANAQFRYFDLGPSTQDPIPTSGTKCDAAAFYALDPLNNPRDPNLAVAFLLSATEGQFEQAKRQSSAQLGIDLNLDVGVAKTAAYYEANAQHFKLSDALYSDYIAQSLTSESARLYSQCVAFEAQANKQFRIWVDKKDGNYVTLNAQWPGEAERNVGHLDEVPLAENLTVLKMPRVWTKGKTEQIVVKKTALDADSYLSIGVSGNRASLAVLGQRATVRMKNDVRVTEKQVVTNKLAGQCVPHASAETCITPQQKGGFLLPGTGKVDEYTGTKGVTYEISVNSPERICAQFKISAAACEQTEQGGGRLVAVERFPIELQPPQ